MQISNELTVSKAAARFYTDVIRTLKEEKVPFLVGGAYAMQKYTGIERKTYDLDLFLVKEEIPHAFEILEKKGYETELTFPGWLAKAFSGDVFVDLIFSSGNGICPVDALWFENKSEDIVFGEKVGLMPREEMIWQKAFIMERERFDGADVLHLFLHNTDELDWDRLQKRFGEHWKILFFYLILFDYVYPSQSSKIPSPVMRGMFEKAQQEFGASANRFDTCRGLFISNKQFKPDFSTFSFVSPDGYHRADELRTSPRGEHPSS